MHNQDREPAPSSTGEEEEEDEWMTIKSDWALARFKEGEDMKAGFEYIFHPAGRKWKLEGKRETLRVLSWRKGSFWYEEESRVMCRKSRLEQVKRNIKTAPRTKVPTVDTDEWTPENTPQLRTPVSPESVDLDSIDFESAIPELAEPEAIPTTTDEEWRILTETFAPLKDTSAELEGVEGQNGPAEGNRETESPAEAGDTERPRGPETPPPENSPRHQEAEWRNPRLLEQTETPKGQEQMGDRKVRSRKLCLL
jgi:hypothetical protein